MVLERSEKPSFEDDMNKCILRFKPCGLKQLHRKPL